ncbi:MAG: hybrid sensor histidine kinase/response regulator [Gemmatimonadetes bacterium]|nr:MAG: hybrid sensor histidine kinase/response regulator [Gemmatimonadota bacterium]
MANESALTSPQRLAALHNTGLLESPAEERLDGFTRLAAQILGVPKVAISLVDETRQYFKSASCPTASEPAGWYPLEGCYCQDVIGRGSPVILADAWNESGFSDRRSNVRAYAGIPLRTANGNVLGAFCAFDERPRDWSKRDIDVLTALSVAVMSEIQRRIAERSAHDSQLRLMAERTLAHAVQQQMPVGVVVAEVPSGRLVSVNAQMTEIFRMPFKPAADLQSYEWTGFDATGNRYSALEWPLARTVLTRETVRAEEIRIRRGDGSDGFIRMSSAPVRDSEGKVVSAVAIVVDMTDQREAERAVRVTDERFKFVAKATNDVIWDWDLRTNSLVWNDSVETVFGHKQNRIYPEIQWWRDHLHVQDRDRVIGGLQAVIDGGGTSWSDHYRYRRADGTYANVMDRGYVARDNTGAAIRVIGAMTDITERSRSEAAIRFQAQLLNAVQQAVVATDPDGLVIFWNTFAEKLYGWAADEAVGKPIEELTPSPFLRQHASEIFERGAAGESWTGEFLVQGKAGKAFPALLTTSPVRDEHNIVLGFVRVSIDLTERRNLEEQFRQSQKMDAVGRLAGGIAHDFNNLLTVIRLNTEIIMEGLDPTDPRSEDVKQIRSAAERASSLTRQLLAFSRKQILQPRVLDMNSVVSSVEPMLRRLIGEDIVIGSNCTARGYVVADPGQLEQILVNLVVNARDAMPQGGRISIETQNAELDETYTSEHAPVVPGRYVMLAVGDTGVGMTRDTREHAFDPFFTTKEAGKGTGLGLATVYGIVKQSGGYVWIYSEPGQGTTLKLYFPEVSSAAAFKTGEYKIMAKEQARGSETILLVEDEEAVRGLTSRILEKQGYRVIAAQHGREAMDIATKEAGHIDLVLTDIVMPGMNGRGLVERLAGIRPRIKSLYMSGYTDDDIVRRGFIEPSKSFLQKPFTSEALLQTVRKVLDEG